MAQARLALPTHHLVKVTVDQPVAVVRRAAGQGLSLAVQNLHLDTAVVHGLKVEVDPAPWYRQLKGSEMPVLPGR